MKAEIFNDVIFPFSLLNGPTVHVETRNSQSRKRGRHVRDFYILSFRFSSCLSVLKNILFDLRKFSFNLLHHRKERKAYEIYATE